MSKNEHYIPAFYLRNFSNKYHRKSINIYIKQKNEFIDNAPIKGQASKRNFYDNIGACEKALCSLETTVAPIVKRIIKISNYNLNEVERKYISYFLANIESRTKESIQLKRIMLEQIKDNCKELMADKGVSNYENIVDDDLDNAFFVYSQTTLAPVLFDLGILFLTITSKSQFITSDNPLIAINPFLQRNPLLVNHSITGFASRGLILTLTLSPTKCIILYDKSIYRTNSIYLNISKKDIILINSLLYKQDSEILFYSDNLREEINDIIVKSSQINYRKGKVSKIILNADGEHAKEPNAVMSTKSELRINRNYSFFSYTRFANKYKWTGKVVEIRPTINRNHWVD